MESLFSADEVACLHRRASVWFAQHNLIDEALKHALAAGSTEYAVTLLETHRNHLMDTEQWDRLNQWLELMPPAILETHPVLLCTKAWVSEYCCQFDQAKRCMDQAEALLDTTCAKQKTVLGEIYALRAHQQYVLGQAGPALASAERANELLPVEAKVARGFVQGYTALARQAGGDMERGLKALHAALRHEFQANTTTSSRLLTVLCQMYAIAGDMTHLKKTAHRCLRQAIKHDLHESVVWARYVLGVYHYLRNELLQATQYLAAVVDAPTRAGHMAFAQCAFVMALIYRSQGRIDEAGRLVETAVSQAEETGCDFQMEMASAFEAELALRQNRVVEAERIAQGVTFHGYVPSWLFFTPQLTLIKILLAQNTPESRQEAAALLNKLDTHVQSTHKTRLRIDVLALQALLYDAQSDETNALETLEEALSLAEASEIVRPFIDLEYPMADLLSRLSRRKDSISTVRTLLAAFRQEEYGVAADASIPPRATLASGTKPPQSFKRLTHREEEVLALLMKGLSNKEIGLRLFLSIETIKKHVYNVYQKLDVHDRPSARERARDLRLLEQK